MQYQNANNNYNGGNNTWTGGGTTYNPNAVPRANLFNNFLTPEQVREIQHNPSFQVKMSMNEYYRSICTHKYNNNITLEKLPNGNHRCTTCSEEFYLFDLATPDKTIEDICKNMYDLLQSTKTYFLNAPEDLKNFYMVIGFIKKVPQLWQAAKKVFEQASNATAFGLNHNYDQNSFQILSNLFGTNMMGMPGQNINGYYYGGAPMPQNVPPMAQYQQPPMNQGFPPYQQQQPMMVQNPNNPYEGYTNNTYTIPSPPPAPSQYQAPAAGANPIGHVDPAAQQMNFQVPVQQNNQKQQQGIAPQLSQIVEQPSNPNIQNPNPAKTLINHSPIPKVNK